MLVWSEIPVYAVKAQYLKRETVRKLAARELETNILTNHNHPSIMLWSIGNELSARPGPVQSYYIERAVRQAKALDPSRPVGLAVAGYPSAGCRPQYAQLDVIGINEYFGWYPGPSGQIADRDALPDYLDSRPRLLSRRRRSSSRSSAPRPTATVPSRRRGRSSTSRTS